MFKNRNRKEGFLARTATLLACVMLASPAAWASDLTKGYSFSLNEQNVTHTKLNNLVDLASINTTFFTDKSATTTPASADLVLLYSSSAADYRKCSLGNLIYANTAVITALTEDTAPATNDYIFGYSTVAGVLEKISVGSLLTNAAIFANPPRSTNAPIPGALFLLASNGVQQTYALTNILGEWWRWMPFSTNTASPTTNFLLSTHTHPTNLDGLLIWDSVTATNKAITLIGLATNLMVVTNTFATNTDYLLAVAYDTNANNLYGTNPTVSQLSVTNLLGWRSYTSSLFPVPNANTVTTLAHGLPGKPVSIRIALVLTNTARLGYSQNDEIDMTSGGAGIGGSLSIPYTVSYDGTSVWLAYGNGSSSWGINQKDTGLQSSITKVDWNVKVYARYSPWYQ